MVAKLMVALGACACMALAFSCAAVAAPEFNPVRSQPISIGPVAGRVIVAFRATPANVVVHAINARVRTRILQSSQAGTSASDVAALMQRAHLTMARSRQLTPSMHVIYLQRTLYGSAVERVLTRLRADPAVKYAEADQRRYPQAIPDDPLFVASADAAGQWYLMPPSPATGDAAATDAVSAWAITTGSTGTVIADIDTGVRFDHPDLLRAGFGGRLLPGYDFVGEDRDSTSGAALGTYLIANDGDGWDPDPSDPGDWIAASDQTNSLFPATDCPVADSSWHGTRVMGILGALTNNAVGIAGMTWNPYLLPVRALGKCGGYDSDIITGMQWAVGMPVTGVPDNPYPADIVNLSLGGSGSCPSDYADAITTLTTMGVLVVASAGNQSGPVDAPGNCTGVLTVAGLRNVGTKVGYSSLGPEVAVAAPAGNCVNSSGPCLRPIDTTSNTGLTVPSDNTYTNETNPNLGTSFSAPLVAGIAALMRAVNANLTPAQLIARIESSAAPFPQPAGLPVCPALSTDGTGECACPNDGSQCGAGMVNALSAVNAALRPIAAVALPAAAGTGGDILDASGSAASCGRTLVAYAWSANGGATIPAGAAAGTANRRRADGDGGHDHADRDRLRRRRRYRHPVRKRGRRHYSIRDDAGARRDRWQRLPRCLVDHSGRADGGGIFRACKRRREHGVDADDLVVQLEWVRSDAIGAERGAARQSRHGDDFVGLGEFGAGDHLFRRGVGADDFGDHGRLEQRQHSGERQLRHHGAGAKCDAGDLHQSRGHRRIEYGPRGRQQNRRVGYADRHSAQQRRRRCVGLVGRDVRRGRHIGWTASREAQASSVRKPQALHQRAANGPDSAQGITAFDRKDLFSPDRAPLERRCPRSFGPLAGRRPLSARQAREG